MHPFKLYGNSFTKTKMGNNQCDDIRSTLWLCLDPMRENVKKEEEEKVEKKLKKRRKKKI